MRRCARFDRLDHFERGLASPLDRPWKMFCQENARQLSGGTTTKKARLRASFFLQHLSSISERPVEKHAPAQASRSQPSAQSRRQGARRNKYGVSRRLAMQ